MAGDAMVIDIDELEANIHRGRAVLKATTSTLTALDRSAAMVQSVVSADRDISSAVELWRVDGRQNALNFDSADRRRDELRIWTPLAERARSAGGRGGVDWYKAMHAVAAANPVGLAVTSAVTLFDDYFERRTHQLGYEKVSGSIGRGLAGIDWTLSSGLGEVDSTLAGGLSRVDQTLGSGLGQIDSALAGGLSRLEQTLDRSMADLSRTVAGGMANLNRTVEVGFQQLSAEFSWGISDLLWRMDQQNATVAEIRDVLTRPLDVQSRELRARAIRSYENGWLDEALADFLDAMEKSRVDYVVAHYLGNIYLAKEDYEAAAEWFKKSARWSRPEEPRHAAVALMHQALAHFLRRTGEDAENCRAAIACLEEALVLDPTNIEARFQHAQYLARSGESDQARVALEDVLDHDGRYLVRILMEPDFQQMSREIADVTYWLSRSYSRTIDRQLRLLAPYLRAANEENRRRSPSRRGGPTDDDVETFEQTVALAVSLYAAGDFLSVQQAQVLLLTLQVPAAPGGPASKPGRPSYGSARYSGRSFSGVGGNLV